MTADALSAEDAVLLAAEAPGTQLQIGALCFFEAAPLRDRGGRIRTAALSAHVSSRLAALPRFRQRIVRVLGDLVVPRWVDDAAFDLRRHVAVTRLPRGGGPDALREVIDGLLAEPLDMAHPLWDLHLFHGGLVLPGADGAPVDAVAVLLRAHHVMADGLALHAAATLLLDTSPAVPASSATTWSPAEQPATLPMSAAALGERTARQVDLVLGAARTLADPRNLCNTTAAIGELLSTVPGAGKAFAPAAPFTRPIGPGRSFAWSTLSMPDLVEIKQFCGVQLNDVVLAIVTGAVQRSLDTSALGGRTVEPRAIIPIGASTTDLDALGNRFSITQVALPIHLDDPLERVRLLHERMHAPRPSAGRRLAPHLFSIADVVPPRLLRRVVPPLLAHQPLVNLAVSNIPGSRDALYLWQSRLLAMHPIINVVGNVGLIVGVLSYGDTLGVGVTVDPDIAGDPRRFAAQLAEAADELLAAVRAAPPRTSSRDSSPAT